VSHLICSHRHILRAQRQNVGALSDSIHRKSKRIRIAKPFRVDLRFERRIAHHPVERNQHCEQPGELGDSRHLTLQHDGRLLRVYAAGEPVLDDVEGVLPDVGSALGARGERVQVRQQKVALTSLLKPQTIFDRAHEVAEMQPSRRRVAGDDARLRFAGRGHGVSSDSRDFIGRRFVTTLEWTSLQSRVCTRGVSMRVSIYRYNPETDEVPYMKDYDFDLTADSDLMVLDVLERLKERDPTLSYRRSCREGVCGSDGMNINGMNALACTTPVTTALQRPATRLQAEERRGKRTGRRSKKHKGRLVLRPLPGMPVIRDLVVDMTQFWRQYEAVKPYLQNDEPPPAQERLQSPEDRARLDGYYECILCGCCTSACPSWWWNPETYIGPAGLLWAYRFLADSRDTATRERLSELDDPFSVFRCRAILNCTAVCPKGLNPRHAISRIEGLIVREGV